MPTKRPRPLCIRVSERAHGNCSPAYLWLRTSYTRLRTRMNVRYPPYEEVAAEMREAGVLGGWRGGERQPVTWDAVRRMWPRVCQDVATDAARRAPRKQMLPKGWKPEEVPAQAQAQAPAPAPLPSPVAATEPRPVFPRPARQSAEPSPSSMSPEEAAAKMAAVMAKLQKSTGWLGGNKKRPA